MPHEINKQSIDRWLRAFNDCYCLHIPFADPVVDGFLSLGWIKEYRPKTYRPTAEGIRFMGLEHAA